MLYRMSSSQSSRAGIPVSPVGYAGFQDLLEDSLHNLMENKVFLILVRGESLLTSLCFYGGDGLILLVTVEQF